MTSIDKRHEPTCAACITFAGPACVNELNRCSIGVTLFARGAWRRRVNDHHEQHGSHTRRTPEVLAVKGAGEREFASGPQNERKNIPPGSAPGLTIDLREDRRDLLKRYGLALVLAGFALFLRGVLPHPEGTALYQLPLTAVILSAWYGGRGPGLLASLICATGTGYWFVPPLRARAAS